MCVCVCACVRACMRVCVCVCVLMRESWLGEKSTTVKHDKYKLKLKKDQMVETPLEN